MKKIILTVFCILPSLVMAHPKSSEWGDLDLGERKQILDAANLCEQVRGAKVVDTYTHVELDGSVGYQGVYNYIYTTVLLYSYIQGQIVYKVIVISEHDANIDNDPISYDFKITNVFRDGIKCTF